MLLLLRISNKETVYDLCVILTRLATHIASIRLPNEFRNDGGGSGWK